MRPRRVLRKYFILSDDLLRVFRSATEPTLLSYPRFPGLVRVKPCSNPFVQNEEEPVRRAINLVVVVASEYSKFFSEIRFFFFFLIRKVVFFFFFENPSIFRFTPLEIVGTIDDKNKKKKKQSLSTIDNKLPLH